ncbi:MBL fold metallo-hydrolase [Lapillicoccus sp.]|uniref:MBL fold metallo-hydrolase n=1 Tax=Lapillicoccus sp. TaxID=1909287 RepID=UPI0032639AF2
MTDSVPWASGQVTERVTCVLAPNPGPMTLDGTNTWVLLEPGSSEAVVVDPGPLDLAHLEAVLRLVESKGARVALTLLTHHHADHAEAAEHFGAMTAAPVRALGAGHDDLGDGETLTVGALDLTVVTTPGHTADSLSFLLPAESALLTGDTVLGRGTTVVAWPDGELEAYLASLERIERLTASGEVARILPGHGPDLRDAAGVVTHYIEHRAERLEQVRLAVASGATDPRAVVELVYADVPREVWRAAELSVRAQLDYLDTHPST